MTGIAAPRRSALGRATIGDQLRRYAQHAPDRVAIVSYDAEGARETLTYGALDRRANAVAGFLAEHGVGKGAVVAVMARNSVDYVTVWLATLKLGAIVTGVNFTLTAGEVEQQLVHAGAVAVMADDESAPVVEQLRGSLGAVSLYLLSAPASAEVPCGWEPFGTALRSAPVEPGVELDEDDPAMLVYTSGTTAAPKGVLVSHRSYLISTTPAWTLSLGLGPGVVWLFVMPFFTIAGLGSMTSIMLCGATIVLVRTIDPPRALELIREEKVTYMAQTPTFYLAMAQVPGFGDESFPSLRRCITYGGTVPARMIEAWRPVAPDVVWGTYWGQSELSQLGAVGWFATLDDVPGGDASWIGKPVPQLEVRVVDEDGNDAEVGELICRSPSVMLGYHRDEERTAEVFRGGWLHTEDIVRIDGDGNLFFVDRRKDVIKTGGMNVSSVEVERTLYTHPAVQEVAVVGVPDPYWSEAVTAFVVVRPGGTAPSEEDVITHCRETLAGYKVPKAVCFVRELPKDPQGKILKRELRARASEERPA